MKKKNGGAWPMTEKRNKKKKEVEVSHLGIFLVCRACTTSCVAINFSNFTIKIIDFFEEVKISK